MSNRPSLDDYVEVPDRIKAFKEQFPNGCLRRKEWHFEEVDDRVFIVYTALAYRAPDDAMPGEGTAWEPFPGTTPYTRNSELMNAETSAWGRALAALGFVGKKIATKEDVQARQGEPKQPNGKTTRITARPPQNTKRPATAKQRGLINVRADEKKLSPLALLNIVRAAGGIGDPLQLEDEEARGRLQKHMDRLPMDLVDPVLGAIDQVDDAMPDELSDRERELLERFENTNA